MRDLYFLPKEFSKCNRSSGDVVVKLFAYGGSGPGLDSLSRRYDSRDKISPASKSRYG